MTICVTTLSGVRHCFPILEVFYPIHRPVPGPDPASYGDLFSDATIVASLNAAAKNVADPDVKAALIQGYRAAVEALRKRAGDDVSISTEQER